MGSICCRTVSNTIAVEHTKGFALEDFYHAESSGL
jgi:hypothetical protein